MSFAELNLLGSKNLPRHLMIEESSLTLPDKFGSGLGFRNLFFSFSFSMQLLTCLPMSEIMSFKPRISISIILYHKAFPARGPGPLHLIPELGDSLCQGSRIKSLQER